MDYPNLLETAFDEFSAVPAAGDFAGAPQLLIWRQIASLPYQEYL